MRRADRLTSAADFRRAYASGRRAATPAVVVHALDTGEERSARVGLSASRVVGGAVRRNQAKRRLREALRPIRGSLRAGVDAVLVATPDTPKTPFQELVDSVRTAAARTGALDG